MKKSAKPQAGDRKQKTPAESHKDEVRKITEENREFMAKLDEEQPLPQFTFAPSLRNAATFLNNPNHPSSVKLDENRVEKTPDFKTKWKTTCQHCRGLLEFAAADAGKQTDCPYCSKEISLQQNPPAPLIVLIQKYRGKIADALEKLSSFFGCVFFGCLVVMCFVDVAHAPRHFLVSSAVICILAVLLGFACQLATYWVLGEEQYVGKRLAAVLTACSFLAASFYEYFQLANILSRSLKNFESICCLICFIMFWCFLILALKKNIKESLADNLKDSFKFFFIGFGSLVGVIIGGLCLAACIVGVFLGIFWVIIGIFDLKNTKQHPPTSQVSQSSWDGSVSQVKDWMKAHANDPSSLQYAGWNSSKLGNGDFDVVVQYRAKNGFGALTLHRGDFVLSPDGTILRANPDMDAP